MNKGIMELGMAGIGGVVSFIVIRTVIGTTNMTGWTGLETVLFNTIVPLLAAVGVIFVIFAAYQKIGK
jgi:hypothetical protein